MKIKNISFLIIALFVVTGSFAQLNRLTDLSSNNWDLRLDTLADWQNDILFVPGTALSKIPVNLPTGGWDEYEKSSSLRVHLPATVEQYFWGKNGNPYGVSGNYLGISWFSTKFFLPASAQKKQIKLCFESVRFRAEVFVNKKFVAYDLVTGTPFDVDISKVVIPNADNVIDVRITDPNGNFDWRDSQNFMWGKYRTQPTHGFGGITGKVCLQITDPVFISDIFVRNKPDFNSVDAQITINNQSNEKVRGILKLSVKEIATGKTVWQKVTDDFIVDAASTNTNDVSVSLKNAELWSPEHPALYALSANWIGDDNSVDTMEKKFGFRWFEVKDINGDKQFFLNNKRIFLLTAISWGFWPENGIFPSDEMARKQIIAAKKLGMNMLNFHRTIGQTNVLDAADELGLLIFEEPGGNQYPDKLFIPSNAEEKMQTDFYLPVRNEKFYRMIIRDRSHPSLIIYNMHNERGAQPLKPDYDEMRMGHLLDPSRILTYNSSNGAIKEKEPDPRFKLHLMPYDTTFYDYGWFDQHHAGGPGCYHDNVYCDPQSYLKFTNHKDEIIYYGEEGAIGTPPRLQLIKDHMIKDNIENGWETANYLKWYNAYDSFLRNTDFKNSFPNVDSLTRKMGNVAYYYQGRAIENCRINNTIDGYAINGWESMKLENHSGIVDNYRNFKGDPELIARYNQPLYLSVKLNHKVLKTGEITTADFYIVNQVNLKGKYLLEISATLPDGQIVPLKTVTVLIRGGNEYGQLLIKGVNYTVPQSGYTYINAVLKQKNCIIAKGNDAVFAVRFNVQDISNKGLVADTSKVIASFLNNAGIKTKSYQSGVPDGDFLLIGEFNTPAADNRLVTDILEWVNNGKTLIVIGNTEKWAAYLAKKEVVDYRGWQTLGTTWYGGNFFVNTHPLLQGLPQSCVFNWEYQCFAAYNKFRAGMRIFNGETVVACVSDHKPEIYSALSIVPHGKGKIILSTLDFISCIKEDFNKKYAEGDGENAAMNTFNNSSRNQANIVGQQLLLNLLKYATDGSKY